MKRVVIVLKCLFLLATGLHAQQYNVTQFGAIGDGATDNTLFIQKAIDACSPTGGKVVIPAGDFLTGTLLLKSNVTLYVSGGATLRGTKELSAYPYLDAGIVFYGSEWARQALIFCKNAQNVSIEGEGTIDGQGAAFPVTTDKKPDRYRNRPYLLWFVGCSNVSVRNVRLRNSAFWMQHYLACEYVKIDGIDIWNHSNKNNDMMDIDGCKFVNVSNITGDSDDDGITIKSTSPSLSENITITNCVLSSHCNALKFGTESTGGFRNVSISNCVIKPSRQQTTIYGKPAGNGGLALEMADGGIMENITINNLVIDGPQVPLFIRLGNRARKYTANAPAPPMGIMRNILISNITATGGDETGCSITGLPGAPIRGLQLQNIRITASGGGSDTLLHRKVDELETLYPEGTMFGKLPSYGLYVRHAEDLSMSNISIRQERDDARPAMIFSDVKQFRIDNLSAQASPKAEASVLFNNGSTGSLNGSSPYSYSGPLFLADRSSLINTDQKQKKN